MPTPSVNQIALQVAVLRLICAGLAFGFGVAAAFAGFEPGWIRGVAITAGVFCVLFFIALRWLRDRGEFYIRVGLLVLMGAVLTIAITIQPFQFGTLGGFVFLGLAIGIAAYERILPAVFLASFAVVLGVLAIAVRSSVVSAATAVFLAIAITSLYAVFGFRRLAESSTAAAIAESGKDPLTGLANRRGMVSAVADLSAIADRSDQRLGCLILDLDRFKMVNDANGHEAGDRVLIATAQRVLEVARRSDLFIRLGGEEFALFTIVAGPADLALIADRLREAIEQLDVQPRVTASVGGALQPTGLPFDLDDLLRNADRQLYLAKEAGKNAVRIDAS